MHVAVDNAALLLAQAEGVLTTQEAFQLEAIAQEDGEVPEALFNAVERLFLWCMEADTIIH
jgi:hypothetical protein